MINMDMSCAVVVGNYVFFSALDFNALLKMNLLSKKIEYICRFENETRMQRLHVKAFRYKKQIWFVPLFGNYIACFYLDKNKMEYIEVPKRITGVLGKDIFWLHTKSDSIRPQFFDAGKVNDEMIYLIPATSDAVVILNMKTGDIRPFYDVVNVHKELMGCGTMCGMKLWMAPYIGNELISLDIKTGKKERIKCLYELGYYFGMCSFANKLWFSTQHENMIIVYDTIKGIFETINIENNRNKSQLDRYMYRDAFFCNGKIWLLPGNAENIVCIDPKNEYSSNIYYSIEHNGILLGMEKQGEQLFFFSYGYVMSLNEDGKKSAFIDICIDETEFQKICNDDKLVEYCNQVVDKIPEEKLGLLNYIRAILLN